jgi:hypothetical protein
MSQQSRQPVELCAETHKHERRQAPRFITAREASSSPLSARDTKVPVLVRDVSTSGIGIVSSRRFERGTLLLIEIQGSTEEVPPLLVGKVAHVTARSSGDWLVGCELARALTEDEVRALAEVEPPPEQESVRIGDATL